MKVVKRLFFSLLFLFLVSSLTKNFFDYRKNHNFYQSYKSEFEKEQQRNTELKTKILKSSDPNEMEKIIRNKLNLLKPGEITVILPEPTPTPVIITPTPLTPHQQWYNTFFKN